MLSHSNPIDTLNARVISIVFQVYLFFLFLCIFLTSQLNGEFIAFDRKTFYVDVVK